MVLAEGVHTLGLFQIPEFMLQHQEELELDQSYKFTLYNFLALMELKFCIPSTTTPNRNYWVVTCGGKIRRVTELRLRDPGHKPTRTESPLERPVAKEREPGSEKMEPSSSIKETHATQFEIPTNSVSKYSDEVIPLRIEVE